MALSNTHTEAVTAAVKSAIEAGGTTANAVAKATGIPQATMSRRLTGSPFSVNELGAIADHLGITLQQLINHSAAA
jgi:predicted transcriptional regulator